MLKTVVRRTPLIPFGGADPIFVKAESLQVFGSYKIRGVIAAVNLVPPKRLAAGLVCASAGNMAQPVAAVARELGVSCRIYVPDSAPEVKKAAIRALGAALIERPFADVWGMVRDGLPDGETGVFIHPVHTPGLTEGYGTIVDEILAELPDADAIVVPFGCGGLTLGLARRAARQGGLAVYTCEPETAAPLRHSLAANRAVRVDRIPSFVDAIGTPELVPGVFESLTPMISGALDVTLADTRAAMRRLLLEAKLVSEGAAAAAVAAALTLRETRRHHRIVAILSGANIASEVLSIALDQPA